MLLQVTSGHSRLAVFTIPARPPEGGSEITGETESAVEAGNGRQERVTLVGGFLERGAALPDHLKGAVDEIVNRILRADQQKAAGSRDGEFFVEIDDAVRHAALTEENGYPLRQAAAVADDHQLAAIGKLQFPAFP